MPFAYCFVGFIAIWLVFDLSDNGPNFIEGKVGLARVARFYVGQLPDIAVISLPTGLLLGVLYGLSRMSRSNEIISMLTAGVSLWRILLPVMLLGLAATSVEIWLNHSLAPHAQATKAKQLEAFLQGRDEIETALDGHLFRNRSGRRTWYAERVLLDRGELHWVQIAQQDEQDNILFKYYVRIAKYLPETKEWFLDKGSLVTFDKEGNIASNEYLSGQNLISGWTETPWRIASSGLAAETMTVPQLRDYLAINADFPDLQLAAYRTHSFYRFALPWACFVVVIIAAPLGIVFSRRGVLAGVASSIFIFFAMIFLTNLFLALGAGGRIPPFWAAWIPNFFFLAVGGVLLWMRSTNRDATSLRLGSIFRRTAPLSK